MDIEIVSKKILPERVEQLAAETFDTMCKVSVDIAREVAAFGGQLHEEGFKALIKDGSKKDDVWGANIFLDQECGANLDFVSLINIKRGWNKSPEIKYGPVRKRVHEVLKKLTSGLV